jgi:hypothetical protein
MFWNDPFSSGPSLKDLQYGNTAFIVFTTNAKPSACGHLSDPTKF